MGALAVTLVVGGSLLIGFVVEYFTRPRSELAWLFVAVATAVGAFIGSELLGGVYNALAPEYAIDGLAIVPAVVAGLTLGLIAETIVRYIATPEAI